MNEPLHINFQRPKETDGEKKQNGKEKGNGKGKNAAATAAPTQVSYI